MVAQSSPEASAGTSEKAWASPLRWLILVAACAVVVKRAYGFYPFMADDAFISLRYARRLLDGGGLTWASGPRVEGYSNLLWTLACAFLGWLGLDLVQAARVLGVTCTLSTVALLAWAFRRRSLLAYTASLSAFALAGPTAVWAIGGLEQPMVELWLALGMFLSLRLLTAPFAPRRAMLAGLAFGLLALSRPDGVLFGATTAIVLSAAAQQPRPQKLRMLVHFCIPIAGLCGAQLLFRLLYYHDFVPNTARAKIAFSEAHLLSGYYYVLGGLLALRAHLILAFAAALVCVRRASIPIVALLLAPLAVWLTYIVMVGGDIFPAWRHFVPVLVLAAFLIGEGFHAVMALGRRALWMAALLLAGSMAVGLYDQGRDAKMKAATTERWEWDGEAVGHFLATAFGKEAPLIAVDTAGSVPYFSGLPAIDMLGLNDYYLGHHPPDTFGSNPLLVGHELGDGAYVLGRRPDLVLFCMPSGGPKPCFHSDEQLLSLPEFQIGYQLVSFEARALQRFQFSLWVRRESPKVGIRRSDCYVQVPAMLLGDDSGATFSRLGEGNRVVTEVPSDTQVVVRGISLSPGKWRLSVEGASEGLRGRVVGAQLARADFRATPFEVDLPVPDVVDVELDNQGSAAIALRALVLDCRSGGAQPR